MQLQGHFEILTKQMEKRGIPVVTLESIAVVNHKISFIKHNENIVKTNDDSTMITKNDIIWSPLSEKTIDINEFYRFITKNHLVIFVDNKNGDLLTEATYTISVYNIRNDYISQVMYSEELFFHSFYNDKEKYESHDVFIRYLIEVSSPIVDIIGKDEKFYFTVFMDTRRLERMKVKGAAPNNIVKVDSTDQRDYMFAFWENSIDLEIERKVIVERQFTYYRAVYRCKIKYDEPSTTRA